MKRFIGCLSVYLFFSGMGEAAPSITINGETPEALLSQGYLVKIHSEEIDRNGYACTVSDQDFRISTSETPDHIKITIPSLTKPVYTQFPSGASHRLRGVHDDTFKPCPIIHSDITLYVQYKNMVFTDNEINAPAISFCLHSNQGHPSIFREWRSVSSNSHSPLSLKISGTLSAAAINAEFVRTRGDGLSTILFNPAIIEPF